MSYIEPIDKTKLQEFSDRWRQFYSTIEKLPCETEEQQNYWSRVLNDAHLALMAVEGERKELIAPILESQRTVNSAFKQASTFAEDVKALAKKKLSEAREAERVAQEKARALVAEVAATGDETRLVEVVKALPQDAHIAGTSTRWEWEASVVDMSLVPRDYLAVDTRKLKDYAKAFSKSESIPPIPGVVFTKKAAVIVGRKS